MSNGYVAYDEWFSSMEDLLRDYESWRTAEANRRASLLRRALCELSVMRNALVAIHEDKACAGPGCSAARVAAAAIHHHGKRLEQPAPSLGEVAQVIGDLLSAHKTNPMQRRIETAHSVRLYLRERFPGWEPRS